jgi:hypothetical protein
MGELVESYFTAPKNAGSAAAEADVARALAQEEVARAMLKPGAGPDEGPSAASAAGAASGELGIDAAAAAARGSVSFEPQEISRLVQASVLKLAAELQAGALLA